MLGRLIRARRGHAPEGDGADRSDDAPQERNAVVTGSAFDVEALGWFARRFDPSLALDNAWPLPIWETGREALANAFGLETGSHFLRHHRGLLPQLWERQITQALRAMILEAPDRTLERSQALIVALAGPRAPSLRCVDLVTADHADRMDLAVHYRTVDDQRGCLVVEAKLESELSDTQLGKYLTGLKRSYPRSEQRHLWVVAPRRTPRTMTVLERIENVEWSFATWRRLLLNWQRALPDDPGSDVLSLFGEIWKRTGGN
jgi:hypothetical protein